MTGDEAALPAVEPPSCLNCGTPVRERFCPDCGQRRVGRITFRGVFADAAHALTNLDSRFLRTVAGLTQRPGAVTREYVEGRREAYMNPVKYAFFTTTFFVLMIHLFEIPVWRLMNSPPESFMAIFSLLSYLVFVNALGAAAVQRLLFLRSGRNLAECYAFVLFCYGHAVLLFLVAAFLGAYDGWKTYAVIPLGTAALLAWGLVGFYGTRAWRAVPSALIMVVAYYFTGALMSFVIGFASRLF